MLTLIVLCFLHIPLTSVSREWRLTFCAHFYFVDIALTSVLCLLESNLHLSRVKILMLTFFQLSAMSTFYLNVAAIVTVWLMTKTPVSNLCASMVFVELLSCDSQVPGPRRHISKRLTGRVVRFPNPLATGCWWQLGNLTTYIQKSNKLAVIYFWAQKNWRKKCVYRDKKISPQKCIYHENVMNLVTE